MANIKSSKKRILTANKNAAENRAQKSRLNTYTKRFKADPTQENYREIESLLDKAAGDNLIHKNKADRLKGKYAKLIQK